MELSKYFRPTIILNIFLFLFFCISINNFTIMPNLHLIFYVLFHLTFIYLLFYYYHYSIYIIAFIYGIFFDIVLLNNLGVHLLTLIILIPIYLFIKKYLIQLSSYKISACIFCFLFLIFLLELSFAYFLYNVNFQINLFVKLIITSVIIFVPSIFLFNKLDR